MSALYQDKGSSDWEFLKIYSRLNVSLLRPLLITLQQTWVRVADASHSTSSGRGGSRLSGATEVKWVSGQEDDSLLKAISQLDVSDALTLSVLYLLFPGCLL